MNDGNVGISSRWVFANTSANRTVESDTDFRGCTSGGLASGTVYMTDEHVPERLHNDQDHILDRYPSQNRDHKLLYIFFWRDTLCSGSWSPSCGFRP